MKKQLPRQAFKLLFDTISTTRKFQFNQDCEHAMKLYIDIGVSITQNCEEGFRSYQLLTQHNHIQSLETIIEYFIESITNIGNKEIEIIKIDCDEQYESKILKYEWESFKSILKIIRNNHKLNDMYQNIVIKCIQFCKTLNFQKEFIDLCWIVRNRYNYIQNNQKYGNSVKINTINVINTIFETRLNILQCSLDMKLYNQSFKIIKDIQLHIFDYTEKLKKNLNTYLCSLFYEKLSFIYWLSNKYFMHSFVLFQSYLQLKQYINTKLKKQTQIKIKLKLKIKLYKLLQQSLLSLLITMLYNNEKTHVFGQKQILPSKHNLLNMIIKEINILIKEENGNILCNIKHLYDLISNDINPIIFTKSLTDIIHKLEIENDINIEFYKDKIHEMGIIILIKCLCKMYKSITWNRFRELTFSNDIISDIELEYIIICNVNNDIISCNISHSNGLIIFGNDKYDNVFKLFMDLNYAFDNVNIKENKKYNNNMRQRVFNTIKYNIPMDEQLIDNKLKYNKRDNIQINNIKQEDINIETQQKINEREEIRMIEERKHEHKINEEMKQKEIIAETEAKKQWTQVIQNQNNYVHKSHGNKRKKKKETKLQRIQNKIKELNKRIQFEMKKKDKNINNIQKLINLLKKLQSKRQLELMKSDKIKCDYFCRGTRKYLKQRIVNEIHNRNNDSSNINERKKIFKQERKQHKDNYFKQICIRDRLRNIRGKHLVAFQQIVIKQKRKEI